jgi:hypothetical protein
MQKTKRRILTLMKANYGVPGSKMEIEINQYGCFDLATVVQEQDREAIELACRNRFLELLAQVNARRGMMGTSPHHPESYAPVVFARMTTPEDGGFTAAHYERAMQHLIDKGQIVEVSFRRPNRHWGSRLEQVTVDGQRPAVDAELESPPQRTRTQNTEIVFGAIQGVFADPFNVVARSDIVGQGAVPSILKSQLREHLKRAGKYSTAAWLRDQLACLEKRGEIAMNGEAIAWAQVEEVRHVENAVIADAQNGGGNAAPG